MPPEHLVLALAVYTERKRMQPDFGEGCCKPTKGHNKETNTAEGQPSHFMRR